MIIGIGRREFISALGGMTLAWPLAARAGHQTAAFTERLRELGWIDARTPAIEFRWSQGRPERVAEIGAEFVRQKVDVIVTYGGAVAILKQTTPSIPIVFAIASDPVGSGLVASLARPGGNITGSSNQGADIAGKRLELLRQVVPGLRRLAIMFDAGYRGAVLEMGQVEEAARKLNFEFASHEIRRAEDIAPVFDALKGQADALYVAEDALVVVNSARIATLAIGASLPTILNSADTVRAGCLMSYGPNFPALFRRAAEFVDRILLGTKPGDIPVEQPTKFDLVVNLTTAKAIGLTIPESFLSLADEVIE